MNKINLILNSQLFTHFRVRRLMLIFLESRNNIQITDELPVVKLPLILLEENFFDTLRFFTFEHIEDENFRKLLFIFFNACLKNFPIDENWKTFLELDIDQKREEVISMIQNFLLQLE